jgi:hypothetical protein
MHKFGDTCRYIRNGEEMNAIVLGVREIEGVEHLTVAYPNKDVAGQMLTSGNVAKAIQVDFDVKPMADGANRGWYDPYFRDFRPLASAHDIAHETKQYADGSSVFGVGPAPTAQDYAEIPGLKEAEASFVENMKAFEQKAKEATLADKIILAAGVASSSVQMDISKEAASQESTGTGQQTPIDDSEASEAPEKTTVQ